MDRDWDAEWMEIAEEYRQAHAAFREARSRNYMRGKISRRLSAAFTRRTVFIAERMVVDPMWPDPDGQSASV